MFSRSASLTCVDIKVRQEIKEAIQIFIGQYSRQLAPIKLRCHIARLQCLAEENYIEHEVVLELLLQEAILQDKNVLTGAIYTLKHAHGGKSPGELYKKEDSVDLLKPLEDKLLRLEVTLC
eukprot:GHVH01009582.1.p1 GENE.GHVH01009582.1~~GHVH01009582.1.p1  ORF type:complete len:121 (+),score=7.52 GHVH01009582.1:109-471(+)